MAKKLNPRKEELSKVWRYGFYESPIFYKTNLLIHIARVKWVAEELGVFLNENYNTNLDINFLLYLAEVHDDAEIITGDFISPLKDSWTQKETEEYEEKCQNAISILVENYNNNFLDFSYENLLQFEESAPDNIYYYLLKYADKLDGNMEVCHELFAGNEKFEKEIQKKFNRTAFEYNFGKCEKLRNKISESLDIPIISLKKHSLFHLQKGYSSKIFLEKSNGLFDKNNVLQETGFAPYDYWRKIHFKYGNEWEQKYLYTQRES